MATYEKFAAVSYKEFIFVANSAEYRISKFNLNNSQVDRTFSRDYVRQRISKETEAEGKRLNFPDFKYHYDIFGLHIFKDSLWVITSTRSEDGTRSLIDVFDAEGEYTDSLHLQFPENNMEYQLDHALFSEDGYIYIPEQDKETGLMSIGKYRPEDVN